MNYNCYDLVTVAALCFVGLAVQSLEQDARKRLQGAFRPKTQQCYTLLFRTFMSFCVVADLCVLEYTVQNALAFLEYMVKNGVSYGMLANYVSAVKSRFCILGLNYKIWAHQNVKYFLKSVRINRPMKVVQRNIIDISTLRLLVQHCDSIYMGTVYKAIFLTAFFGFFRLSNLAPHAIGAFDATRHFVGSDVIFTTEFLKLIVKWSKTMQNRDSVHYVTLPRLKGSSICPFDAIRKCMKLYNPQPNEPLFQIFTAGAWAPLTDTKIRKCLSRLNVKLGFTPGFFTFHSFRRSGATFAYNADIPIQDIKHQGSWASDCVWTYIQAHHSKGDAIARSFAKILS